MDYTRGDREVRGGGVRMGKAGSWSSTYPALSQCYVRYRTREEAEASLKSMNSHPIYQTHGKDSVGSNEGKGESQIPVQFAHLSGTYIRIEGGEGRERPCLLPMH